MTVGRSKEIGRGWLRIRRAQVRVLPSTLLEMDALQDKRRPAIQFFCRLSRPTAPTTKGSRIPGYRPGAYREGNEENLHLRAI
jgi:hypothetical protein